MAPGGTGRVPSVDGIDPEAGSEPDRMRAWVWMAAVTPGCGADGARVGGFVRVPACRIGLRAAMRRAAAPAVAVRGQRMVAAAPP
jgi:hypothetical protein